MRIRRYRAEDKPDCLAIFDSNCPPYFVPAEREPFAAWLDHPDREAYYVLEHDGQLVACGGIFHDSAHNSVGLAWGMVHAAFHRQGYGRQLTQYRLTQLQTLYPGKRQRIETSQHTLAFYEQMGFTVERMEPNGFGPDLDKYELSRDPSY